MGRALADAYPICRETLEEADGLVHYLCEQRWIEITPYSPRCELGKSRTRLTTIPN